MAKVLSIVSIAAVVLTALLIISRFAAPVNAGEPVALRKADRLSRASNCATQTWPHFDRTCLRFAASASAPAAPRVIAVERNSTDRQPIPPRGGL